MKNKALLNCELDSWSRFLIFLEKLSHKRDKITQKRLQGEDKPQKTENSEDIIRNDNRITREVKK